MKNISLFAFIIVSIFACNQGNQKTMENPKDTISTGKNSIKYTCPMHPKVVENKPGVCRKCGMDLVEKE